MNEVVPFGKYKGQPIELLAADPQYCDWLASQDWFRERYSKIYTVIINNFAQPEDTPEHNKMQARFLDNDFAKAAILAYWRGHMDEVEEVNVKFEKDGFDVFVESKCLFETDAKEQGYMWLDHYIELKPTIGDDYPTIMRQMSANKNGILSKSHGVSLRTYLIYDGFSGNGITENEMRKMFQKSGIQVASIFEIEEIIRRGGTNET